VSSSQFGSGRHVADEQHVAQMRIGEFASGWRLSETALRLYVELGSAAASTQQFGRSAEAICYVSSS
jgi:hypothetical protein